MKRIAILGGGISGLTAAYELEQQRRAGKPIDWRLYEATDRLGGIVQTTRHATPEGDYILEGGPDGWVTEKPWARDLAVELGLEADLIYSNDATRKTYILLDGQLQPTPDRMRLMVPEDLAALDNSPLFSPAAKQAYHRELDRAEELKAAIPTHDESVASFVRRHFGTEVLDKIAAPLLSGVFGGDVHQLSVRAVMPQFVDMERQHGSLIAALQAKARQRGNNPPNPTFTTLRRGMASLVEALISSLPPQRLRLNCRISAIGDAARWSVTAAAQQTGADTEQLDQLILATSLDQTRQLLCKAGLQMQQLLPTQASSAILVCFVWPRENAAAFTLPAGFGFLVPPAPSSSHGHNTPGLLAATFANQKFPCRAPAGARILRAFFGGHVADELHAGSDQAIASKALGELRLVLPNLPDPNPSLTTVRRWPRSLPQYEVGHLDRMAELEFLNRQIPGLQLLGNACRGVGIPDLIRDARSTARAVAAT